MEINKNLFWSNFETEEEMRHFGDNETKSNFLFRLKIETQTQRLQFA